MAGIQTSLLLKQIRSHGSRHIQVKRYSHGAKHSCSSSSQQASYSKAANPHPSHSAKILVKQLVESGITQLHQQPLTFQHFCSRNK